MIVFLFVFGTAIGSFLNVLIDRIPKNESVVKGRSYCDSCHKKLAWYDLIPLLSFILLNGRCRYCHKSVSWQYPVVEMATGILFVFVYWWILLKEFPISNFQFQISNVPWDVGTNLQLLFILFVVCSFIVIFMTDIKYGIIPDKVVFSTILVAAFYLILNTKYLILGHLFSAICGFLFFFALFLVTKGKGMGFGDVKLAFLLGLVLGYPGIVVALYIAFLTGGIISTILVLWGRKRFFGGTIPFGPFLILGAFVALFFANPIIENLLSFLRFI